MTLALVILAVAVAAVATLNYGIRLVLHKEERAGAPAAPGRSLEPRYRGPFAVKAGCVLREWGRPRASPLSPPAELELVHPRLREMVTRFGYVGPSEMLPNIGCSPEAGPGGVAGFVQIGCRGSGEEILARTDPGDGAVYLRELEDERAGEPVALAATPEDSLCAAWECHSDIVPAGR